MENFIIPRWPAPPGIRAYQTTRIGGGSKARFGGFNLAEHVGDDPGAVLKNRRLLRERLDAPSQPCWLKQVHGTQVVDLAHYDPRSAADAAVTFEPGVVVAVMTADCLPVLFCNKKGSVVAAAHAGWRGLAAGILEATIAAMGVDPREILAWFGPAIGPGHFEVGDEVREAFIAQDLRAAKSFKRNPCGRWQANLYELARGRLERAGVLSVYGGGECTFDDEKRFFSYRRDGQTGRMATLIWF